MGINVKGSLAHIISDHSPPGPYHSLYILLHPREPSKGTIDLILYGVNDEPTNPSAQATSVVPHKDSLEEMRVLSFVFLVLMRGKKSRTRLSILIRWKKALS